MAKVFSNPRPAIALATRTILAAGALVLITQACRPNMPNDRRRKTKTFRATRRRIAGPHFSRCIRS